MNAWIVIVAGGVLTFGMRLSFIYLFGRRQLPDKLRRALRYVPPAVLSAIVLPELLMPSGVIDASPHNLRLLAGVVAIVVAWRTKSTVATIVVGMAALIVWQLIF